MSEAAPQSGAVTQTDPETEFDDLDVDTPLVGIIMGSKSDMPEMEKAGEILAEKGIHFEVRVMSAHRDPETVADYCRNARMRGLKVIIAGAGGAAHLAGVMAAKTHLPVLGVPMESQALKGMDSLLSIVQMPAGVPVGTVAIGKAGAVNAALLAVSILALADEGLRERLLKFRDAQTSAVLAHPDPSVD
jgi:5-(carboxyamino)imidazole ribonucleotide mutase